MTNPIGSCYIALVWPEQRTQLPRIPPLLSDVLSRLLHSGGSGIVDGEHGFVSMGTCLLAIA
jgi:hypothetical protein